MRQPFDYCVVDAFTAKPFGGNPAAVIFGADALDDMTRQTIAREFNLSETTFVLAPTSDAAAVRFRWFTPTTEVRMCGHATLGGLHALLERGFLGRLAADAPIRLSVETASGCLAVQIEQMPSGPDDVCIWLELPAPKLTRSTVDVQRLSGVAGFDGDDVEPSLPPMATQDDDLIVFLKTYPALMEVQPHFAELAQWQRKQRVRGLCLATLNTLSPAINVQSRFFAPAEGIDEDPVTGSVHGPLATYLVAQELVPHSQDTSALTCVQSSPTGRSGLVRALVTQHRGEGFSVRIGGQCQTTMRGTLYV